MALSWLSSHPWKRAIPAGLGDDTYYVVAHFHLLLGLSAVFLAFAGAYLALELARRGRRRRFLGALHFGATLAGALVMLFPVLAVRLPASAVSVGDPRTLALWSTIAAAGYLLMLAAQAFFVAVLVDAFRRNPVSR